MAQSGTELETNDVLRSEFVRRLLIDQVASTPPQETAGEGIPRVLVRFWHDAEVPHDVADCMRSWDPLREAGFELRTFEDRSAEAYIARTYGARGVEAFHLCGHPAMRSDYFRLCWMHAQGGVYVDADDVLATSDWSVLRRDDRLKLQPLCYDLGRNAMVPAPQIWESDEPAPDRIFYVNNNPLVAPPEHPVIRRALERATRGLLTKRGAGEIQSTTGPGNLTIALAMHAHDLALAGQPYDFEFFRDWDHIGRTKWDLSYRSDWRNWRNMGNALQLGPRVVRMPGRNA